MKQNKMYYRKGQKSQNTTILTQSCKITNRKELTRI